MNLHEDSDAFAELIATTAQNVGLPQVYVEKDYWVSRALKYLSHSSYVNDVVFKGGTSLSKAYRLIDRFSEDIDLAVFAYGKSDNARKKLLKDVEANTSQGIIAHPDDVRNSKGSSYRKTVYQYPRHIDENDFGQASSELLIEVNAFTHPEPFERRELQTLIADMLNQRDELALIERFGLEGFSVNVLSVRRTLVEKILGVIKDSCEDDPVTKLSGRIRHLFDICLILRHDEHRSFVESEDFKSLCETCIEDEATGFLQNSKRLEVPLYNAPLFREFENWLPSLENTFNSVFSQLVYAEMPSMDEIEQALVFIRKNIASQNI